MGKKKQTAGEKIVAERIADIAASCERIKGTIDRMHSGNYMHHKEEVKSTVNFVLSLLTETKWKDGLAGAFDRNRTSAIKRAVRKRDGQWEYQFRSLCQAIRRDVSGAPSHNIDQWNQCVQCFERMVRDIDFKL